MFVRRMEPSIPARIDMADAKRGASIERPFSVTDPPGRPTDLNYFFRIPIPSTTDKPLSYSALHIFRRFTVQIFATTCNFE